MPSSGWHRPTHARRTREAAFVGFTRPAAEAFKKHRVKRVVGVSALGRGTPWAPHAGYVVASLAMDDLIASTGVAYRALTNPSFMDNIVHQADAIKNQGMFFSPIDGDRKLPAVATRDIAAAASRLLLDEIISEVLGKEVRFQQTTFEAYKDRFVGLGMSEAMAQGMADMAWAKNEGLDNAVKRTQENSTPTSFRDWCEEVLKAAVNGDAELAAVVDDEYGGRAERVWTDAADGADLRRRISSLPGFGEMKIKSLSAVLAKRFDVAAAQEIAPSHPTLGDVDSPQALEDYQAKKRAHKAEMRAKQQR